MPTIWKDEKQLELLYTACGNINWNNHLGKLTMFTTVEHTCLSNSTPRYIPKKYMHMCTKRYVQACLKQHYCYYKLNAPN